MNQYGRLVLGKFRGGSVDSLNFRKISEIKNINGALIGGSSLKYSELKKIVSSIN